MDFGSRGERGVDSVTGPFAVLAAKDGVGAGRNLGTGRDLGGLTRGQRQRLLASQHPMADSPRAGASHSPAIHADGVERG